MYLRLCFNKYTKINAICGAELQLIYTLFLKACMRCVSSERFKKCVLTQNSLISESHDCH